MATKGVVVDGSMRCIFSASAHVRMGVTTWSTFLLMLKLTPRERRQDVAEEDAPSGALVTVRPQRHPQSHLGDLGPLVKGGVLLSQVAVLLDVPPGLPHHPDGNTLGGLAVGRVDQAWSHRICSRNRRRRRAGGRGGAEAIRMARSIITIIIVEVVFVFVLVDG